MFRNHKCLIILALTFTHARNLSINSFPLTTQSRKKIFLLSAAQQKSYMFWDSILVRQLLRRYC